MEKNYLQDVIPPAQKRSIRNIPIPGHRRVESAPPIETPRPSRAPEPIEEDEEAILPPPPNRPTMPQYENHDEYKPRSRKPLMFLGGIVVVAILFVVLATVFAHATVNLTPKEAEASIKTTLAISGNGSGGSLTYEPVQVTKEASKELQATGEEKVSESASGKITVYNNYSDKPQPLVKRTRFETKEGKVFRIQESIVVPGQKTENGKKVPGSIEVEVFADEPGDSYNIGPSDFTIPGFKDMEQFDTFYAKSTGSMTGGFVGVKKVVSKEAVEKAAKDLEAQLQTELISMANEKKTEGKVLVYDDQSVTFDSVKQTNGDKDTVVVSRGGTLTAYAFDELALSGALATVTLDSYQETEPIKIADMDALAFSIIRGEAERLEVEGDGKFVWQINVEEIKEKIVGTSEKDFQKNVEEVSGISKADVSIKPFWKSSFPGADDITVNIVKAE